MSLYGTEAVQKLDDYAKSTAVYELFMLDDIINNSSTQEIKEFCESQQAQILVEKQVLNKPTLHRLSKEDDLKRRIKLICYRLAKEAGDPLWTKLVKYQKLKKSTAQAILNKYGTKAERIAKVAQKEYIKKAKKMKATAEEQKAQNAKA